MVSRCKPYIYYRVFCFTHLRLDYTIQEEFRKTKGIPLLPNDLNVSVFGEEDPSIEHQKEYSPVYHVSQYTPPVFLVAAQNDGMVPAIQSIRMAEALHTHGISYELRNYCSLGKSISRDIVIK